MVTNKNIMPFTHRKCFAMFMCDSLPLEVELGRIKNMPLDERLCKMCTQQSIENEVPILLECPLYDDLRENILSCYHIYHV